MTGPFQILIISADPQLAPECEAALASLPGEAAVVHRVVERGRRWKRPAIDTRIWPSSKWDETSLG